VVVKVTYKAGPFPDRRAQYAAEIAKVRVVAAAATRVVFGVIAIFFALGALLAVAGQYVSATNPLVEFINQVAGWFEGPFSRDGGVFSFTGENADRWNALVNWGLASLVYSLIGSVLRAVMRPQVGPDRERRSSR